MPYVIYMKTYSYLDKYLFTYFDKFIKNPSYRLFSEGELNWMPYRRDGERLYYCNFSNNALRYTYTFSTDGK